MPEQNGNASIEDTLREIRAAYTRKLPDRLREIADALAQCLEQPDQASHRLTLRGKLHSLAGSAGSFGYAELGQRAGALEVLLNGVIDGGAPAGGFAPIADGVRQMLHWAGQAPAAETPSPAPAPPAKPQPASERLVYLLRESTTADTDVAAQLAHFGYEVAPVEPGTLFARLDERQPAALVMDLDSSEAIAAAATEITDLRAAGRIAFPLIFISARSDFAARLATVRCGAEGYFSRPFGITALVDRLDALIGDGEISPYRILVVDDDREAADFYCASLRAAGMETYALHDPQELLRTLAEFRPELIMLDVYMPECDGIELARLIRQDNMYLDIPIVFLSREIDFNRQLDAIASGADEFLTKPIEPAQLVSALSSRARRYRGLRGLIMRDSLTGLLNHSALTEQLEREVARARRGEKPMSLVMLDVDHFKQVNDTHGHPVGDQVLRGLARLLQQRLRRVDVIGRYGGEEFCVIMPSTTAADACRVMDEIRLSFGKLLHLGEKGDFRVSFSAGVAEIGKGMDAEALMRAADAALYQAKRDGRDRVHQS